MTVETSIVLVLLPIVLPCHNPIIFFTIIVESIKTMVFALLIAFSMEYIVLELSSILQVL